MGQPSTQDLNIEQEQVIRFVTKVGFSIILTFGIILCFISFAFLTIGLFTTQLTGLSAIPINLITIGLLLIGATVTTYYYQTRYIRRELIIKPNGICLKVGKRSFEYLYSEFSLVALSVAHSHYGAKGFIIRLFLEDLEGDYVDLPIYRFPKSIDVFDLRNQIEEKVRVVQNRKV